MRQKDGGVGSSWPDKTAISRLRLLDFDDLYLLSHLLEGQTIAATAKQLGLTQPAITQRVRKIERVFAEPLLVKVGRHVRLTREGRAICLKAAEALTLMQTISMDASARHLTVAAEPDLLRQWLGRAIVALGSETREGDSLLVNAVSAAESEWQALIEAGQVDAALTVRDDVPGGCAAVRLADVEYLFIASPELAARLAAEPAQLAHTTLLERDRGFAWTQRIETSARERLKLGEPWFLGGDAQVLSAAAEGLGVAVLPASLAAPAVSAGLLQTILPDIDLVPGSLHLVHRVELKDDARLMHLVAKLSETLSRSR